MSYMLLMGIMDPSLNLDCIQQNQKMPGDDQVSIAADVVVVMVPFVAQGHLNQLVHLSRLVSAYNIPVHFVTTTHHITQARSRHRSFDQLSDGSTHIHFHEFPTPPFTTPPPHPSVPFPTHLQPSFDTTIHLRRPVADLIRSLSQKVKRVAVVHDILMSYVVQDVQSIPNAETYVFQPPPAFYRASSHWEKTGGPFPVDLELMNRLPSQDGISSPEFIKFVMLQRSHLNFHVGELYDSSRVIEGKFIEYLEKEEIAGKTKMWAIGPFNPILQMGCTVTVSQKRHKCLQWLDGQPANSVIYVSFGTTTTFTNDQIRELAIGLERSGQRFIWVVRPVDIGNECGFEDRMVYLPDGFEERVKGRGFVERRWSPQLEILGHFATGGFMSHCGWNSSIESISMGVPMATWPMHSDQPRNAFLITEVLGIGVAMKDWERRKELVTAVVVEDAVKTLLVSKEGEEMRGRAEKLAGDVKRSMEKGGSSRTEMESFISYILR